MRGIWRQFIEAKLHRVGLLALGVISTGAVAFSLLEGRGSLFDAVWWAVVTTTTVGYGDISPASLGGRAVAVLLMISGIGFLGVFTATVAGLFVEKRLLRNKGLRQVEMIDHYVICGWSFMGGKLIAQLRSDLKSDRAPIVIVAERPENPVTDPQVEFVRGEIDLETLAKANLGRSQAVIVLGDDRFDPTIRDARTILDTLTIKSTYPDVYVCVELMEAKNIGHCRRAGADEIVVVGELATGLLARAALDHGVTGLVSDLVNNDSSQELYMCPVPEGLVGQSFIELMTRLKRDHGWLPVGVAGRDSRAVHPNPEADYRIASGDRLVIIAENRPDLGLAGTDRRK
jgi:voltage-gated potassium channel